MVGRYRNDPRLRNQARCPCEIKGILTRGSFLASIVNSYSERSPVRFGRFAISENKGTS